jgi:hypothetical protein
VEQGLEESEWMTMNLREWKKYIWRGAAASLREECYSNGSAWLVDDDDGERISDRELRRMHRAVDEVSAQMERMGNETKKLEKQR